MQGMEGKHVQGTEGKRETCGPLDITRHVKDDGRALILYTLRKREKE
jgi:hypothetical protein